MFSLFRSPVHIVATSKSLHSYARPPPVLSEGESCLSTNHWEERTNIKRERVCLFNTIRLDLQIRKILFFSNTIQEKVIQTMKHYIFVK